MDGNRNSLANVPDKEQKRRQKQSQENDKEHQLSKVEDRQHQFKYLCVGCDKEIHGWKKEKEKDWETLVIRKERVSPDRRLHVVEWFICPECQKEYDIDVEDIERYRKCRKCEEKSQNYEPVKRVEKFGTKVEDVKLKNGKLVIIAVCSDCGGTR